jgi:hypothetical protein
MTGGAGNTEAGGRRRKASKERNRGKWHTVVPGALWRFEPTLLRGADPACVESIPKMLKC